MKPILAQLVGGAAGGAQGVACHGAPTANFTVTGGLVTQC